MELSRGWEEGEREITNDTKTPIALKPGNVQLGLVSHSAVTQRVRAPATRA